MPLRMKLLKAFLVRLFCATIPLLAIYAYAEMAFRANRKSEHPTDVGLGIAMLLTLVATALFIGFLVDLVKKLRLKDYKTALIDVAFLIPFVLVITYIVCQMTSRECLCGWLIKAVPL